MTAASLGARGRLAAAAVAVVAASGCTSAARPVLPPSPPVIHVSMDEYAFEIAEDTIPRGRVMFAISNDGRIEHRLALIPLPEDFPPIEEQVRSDDHRFVQELAAIPDRAPGETGFFAVDLAPARYGIACFVVDPDGVTHAEKGMVAEFRVG